MDKYTVNEKYTHYYDIVLEKFVKSRVEDTISQDIILHHSRDVLKAALWINEKLKLKIDRKEIAYVAYLHDLFSEENKAMHHHLIADLIENNWKELSIFDNVPYESRKRIAMATLEHRSCLSLLEYHSPLSALMSAADMGFPILENIVGKAFLHDLIKNNGKALNLRTIAEDTKKYLKGKYSINGNVKYNHVYKQAFKSDIDYLYKKIQSISTSTIVDYGNKYATSKDKDLIVNYLNGATITAEKLRLYDGWSE